MQQCALGPLVLLAFLSQPAISAETLHSVVGRLCARTLSAFRPAVRSGSLADPAWHVRHLPPIFIQAQVPFQAEPVIYSRTNRDLFELRRQMLFPRSYVQPELLRGLKVVDLACGDGNLVHDLRRAGVDAIGVDLVLDRKQEKAPHFLRGSLHDLPLADASVDVAISTMGPITYSPGDAPFVRRILSEVHRVLKPGGTFLISPIHLVDLAPEADVFSYGARPEIDLARTGLWPLPAGWRLKAVPDAVWFMLPPADAETEGPYYWLVLEKI